jgi:hypothetical protein
MSNHAEELKGELKGNFCGVSRPQPSVFISKQFSQCALSARMVP